MILILILAINVFYASQDCVFAQQAIIELPTPQVLEPGKMCLILKDEFSPYNRNVGYAYQIPAIIIGIPKAELQLSPQTIISNESTLPLFNVGLKSTLDLTETTKFTTTLRTYINLQKKVTPLNLWYFTFSQRIPKINSRFTAGVLLTNEYNFLPNQVGPALGYEYTVIPKKFLLVSDWQYGNQFFDGLSVGAKYFFTPLTLVTAAVIIPNANKTQTGFVFAFTKYTHWRIQVASAKPLFCKWFKTISS